MVNIVSDTPSLCVAVCVHNACDYARICIKSVLRHTSGHYELILVNDGSDITTSDMLAQFTHDYAHVRLITHSTAQGYTKAANAALRASDANYVILLNSDAIVSPGWNDAIIACGESDAKIGMIGPLSNAATYQSVPHVFDEKGRWKQNVIPGDMSVADYARIITAASAHAYPRVPVANGFCFTIKREVIRKIGYFDDDTFPQGYGEENDYCIRAADAGFDIAIADDAYVYHATSKSFGNAKRKALTHDAHFAIRSKHGKTKLDAIDHALRHHGGLQTMRERIQHALNTQQSPIVTSTSLPPCQKANHQYKPLFLLPECYAKAGGTQVVIETARGLHMLGVPVKIAAKMISKKEYEQFFFTDHDLFFYYDKDEELIEYARDYDIAIATIFHSVELLKKLIKAQPHLIPAYYVQDYEPFFWDEYPHFKKQALKSYTLIPGNHLVALSAWVCDVIKEKHKIEVHKVKGSFDQSIFYPDLLRERSGPVTISAMIRPSTAWRGPKMTLEVMQALHTQYGDKVRLCIFGCTKDELEKYDLPVEFPHSDYGILGRMEVASLLHSSDIFMDLSTYQAFGRTALEAMACGAAVILPQEGGAGEFAKHEENALMIDTQDKEVCIAAASRLINDMNLRQRLQENGIECGLDYSIHHSAISFLRFIQNITSHKAKQQQVA